MSLSFDNSEAGCMLFYDCHRSVPAPFLTKTYHLVNDPSTNEIVSWGEDDTTFVVWRPPEFARDLLPNYFKHNNFSSFVRQLNTYVSSSTSSSNATLTASTSKNGREFVSSGLATSRHAFAMDWNRLTGFLLRRTSCVRFDDTLGKHAG